MALSLAVSNPAAFSRRVCPLQKTIGLSVTSKCVVRRNWVRTAATERPEPVPQATPASSQASPSQQPPVAGEGAQQQNTTPEYDLSIWHYKPWWCQPPMIILVGVLFIVGSNLLTEASLKTTLLAAAPVSLWWYIFLFVLPKQFKEFAVDYLQTHPELNKQNVSREQN